MNHTLCPTGVKNAHPIVVKYDIGANDEPNGHGTVAVKWEVVDNLLKDFTRSDPNANRLRAILEISNLTVGDAIANLLMIESILKDLDMSVADFANIY